MFQWIKETLWAPYRDNGHSPKGGAHLPKLFKRSFLVPYTDTFDGLDYPNATKAKYAIAEYCAKMNWEYSFVGEDQVVIDGTAYRIYRGYLLGGRGHYGVKCREI